MGAIKWNTVVWALSPIGVGVLLGCAGSYGWLYVWSMLTNDVMFQGYPIFNLHIFISLISAVSVLWGLVARRGVSLRVLFASHVFLLHMVFLSTVFTASLIRQLGLMDRDTVAVLVTSVNVGLCFFGAWLSYRIWLINRFSGSVLWLVALYLSMVWAFNGFSSWGWVFPYGGGYELVYRG